MSFSQSPDRSHQPKSMKFIQNSLSLQTIETTKYSNKIKAMPLLYENIEYKGDLKPISKVVVRGYKHVSRVKAAGEFTIEILTKMKQASCLKLIKNLDFDPYFCETSGLKPLFEVLKKLKVGRCLDGLNLTFRRFTQRNEVARFSPCLARLDKMKKFRVEIPNPQGMEHQEMDALGKGCLKYCSLKSLDLDFHASKDVMNNLYKIQKVFLNALNIEKVNASVNFSHIDPDQIEKPPKRFQRIAFHPKLKSYSVKFGFKTTWSSYFDGSQLETGFEGYLRMLPTFVNPVYLSITFDKMQTSEEFPKAFEYMLPLLTDVRFLNIELNTVKLTEFELMILAKAFVSCKHIEHLTFKYFDNTTLSVIYLMQFIIIMAKFSPFPKFDLFFRKIEMSEWQTREIEKKLCELENIKYVLTKQSLHIQKRPVEIE